MNERRNRRPTRRTVAALVVMWLAIFVLGFVAQTTELFGAHGGTGAWLLLAAAAVGFIVTGSLGVWLVLSGLDEHDPRGSSRS